MPRRKLFREPADTAPQRSARPQRGRSDYWMHGRHAVMAALANRERRCRRLLALTSALERFPEIRSSAQAAGIAVEPVARERLDALVGSEAAHQGLALLAAPLDQPDLDQACAPRSGTTGRTIVVVVDQASDPRNLGAVLRASAAFGAVAVVTTRQGAPMEGPALAKVASGALERVPLVVVGNLARALAELKGLGYWCVGLAAEGMDTMGAVELAPAVALVMGAEDEGLRQLTRQRCDLLVRLPTVRADDSINLASAAAIALYECVRAPIAHRVRATS